MDLFADRLTLSIDWYRIKLDNAIGDPGSRGRLQQCLDAQYNPLVGSRPGLAHGCGARRGESVLRPDPTRVRRRRPVYPGNYGADRKFSAQYINQGGIETEGHDIQVDWGVGNFNVNFQTQLARPLLGVAVPRRRVHRLHRHDHATRTAVIRLPVPLDGDLGQGALSIGMRLQYLPSLDPRRARRRPRSVWIRTSNSTCSAAAVSASAGSCATASTMCWTRSPSGSPERRRTTRLAPPAATTIRSADECS